MIAWSNAGTSSDVTNLLLLMLELSLLDVEVSPALVLKLAVWSLHEHFVANFHRFKVLSHCTSCWEFRVHILAVDLDHEVDSALLQNI